MNIRNRLIKLERKTGVIVLLGFCNCNGEQFEVIIKEPILYNPYATGEYQPYRGEPEEPKETPSETCLSCAKQIFKRVVYLQGIHPTYENRNFEV